MGNVVRALFTVLALDTLIYGEIKSLGEMVAKIKNDTSTNMKEFFSFGRLLLVPISRIFFSAFGSSFSIIGNSVHNSTYIPIFELYIDI